MFRANAASVVYHEIVGLFTRSGGYLTIELVSRVISELNPVFVFQSSKIREIEEENSNLPN